MIHRLLALLSWLSMSLALVLAPALAHARDVADEEAAEDDGGDDGDDGGGGGGGGGGGDEDDGGGGGGGGDDDGAAPPAGGGDDDDAPPAGGDDDDAAPPAGGEDDAAPPEDDAAAPAGDDAAGDDEIAVDDDAAGDDAAGDDAAGDDAAGGDAAGDGDASEGADDGLALEGLAEGDASDEAIERAIAGLPEDELMGMDGERVDPELAAMLAEDYDGPLTDEQEAAVFDAWDAIEGVELDAELRAELGGLPPEQMEALAEVSPKELAAAHELTPAFAEQLEAQAEATAGLSPEAIDALTKVFIQILRKKLAEVRKKVIERTEEKVRTKQAEKIGTIITILLALSPLGLLLLMMPLVLKKQYPTQMPTLVRASAIAALSFVGAMIMFTGLLYVLRVVQGEAGMATNPQIRVVEASFDAVDRNLDEIAALPGLLEVPLQQLLDGKIDALEVAILENVKSFKEDVTVFDRVADMFRSVNWLFGWVSIVLTLLTVVLFLLTIRPTLTEIVKLPARAAKGEVAPGKVVGMVGKRIGNELLATLCVAGLAVVVSLVSGFIEARLVAPAMDTFVMQLLVDMQYVFVEPKASTAYVYVSMGCVVAFLVLNIAVVVLSGAFFIGKAQKVLRLRFHDAVPLSEHKKFWIWGPLGLLWALLLPYLVIMAVLPLAEWIVDSGTTGEFAWGRVLVAGPLALVLGFIVLFFAGQGLRGMLFSMKHKVPKPAPIA